MPFKKRLYLGGSAIALFALMLVSVSSQAASTSGDTLTNKQVKELIANAKTPADHMKLAKHFDAKADELAAESQKHAQLADQYRHTQVLASDEHTPTNYYVDEAEHCAHLASKLSEAADAARDLAHDHEKVAQQASK